MFEKLFFCFTNSMLILSIVNLIVSTMPCFQIAKSTTNTSNITTTADSNSNLIDQSVSIVFSVIEFSCVGWFTLEIFLRYLISLSNRQFFTSVYNLIDIGVLVPFYAWLCLASLNLKILKEISRMLKILRLFKCTRYSSSLNSLGVVVVKCLKEFTILLFYLSVFVLIFSSFLFYLEADVSVDEYPDREGFVSIPKSMW